jgi:RNA polymerase subunit RPABC4/transcription elongation factor Spt4
MTYAEKLQDPRWQKKRTQVLNRDNFTCKLCGDTKETLDVHHHLYEKGKDPWEYSDDVLDTYCRKCHKLVEHIKKETPSVSVVKTFYRKSTDESFYVFVICMEKSKPLLVVYIYHHINYIELLLPIPSHVINLVSSLYNLQTNG